MLLDRQTGISIGPKGPITDRTPPLMTNQPAKSKLWNVNSW